MRALDRDPARGFPPRGAQPEHAADSWYSAAGGYAPADSYAQSITGGHAPAATGGYAAPPTGGYAPPATGAYAAPATAGYAPPATNRYPPPGADSYAAPTTDSYPPPGGSQRAYLSGDDTDFFNLASDDELLDRPARRRLPRRPLAIGMAAVLVAVLGAGAYYYKFVYEPRSATATADNALKLPTTDATAGNPYFSKKLGQWQHIDTRKQDPTPLTIDELYPPAFTLSSSEYLRATSSLTTTCGNAVFGDLIQASLEEGGCTQVARASYISGDGKIMGTIGVANLSSAYHAEQAAKTVGSSELVAPLTAAKGPTKNLLSGTGLAFAEVKGHYLILLYAEFANTKTPKTDAEKQELVAFADGMFSGSADIGLSHRMLYGKP